MNEIVKHINDTNASYRNTNVGDAKNTDLFLDNEHYDLFKGEGDQVTVRFSKENLAKAILFIASILPRKYDNSAIHKLVYYSPEFVYDQLAFLNYYFKEDGRPVAYKTQKWNPRKDVRKKNGEIDHRFFFNGLLEDVEYVNSKGDHVSSKFTIRNYLAGGYSDLHIKKAVDGIYDVWITNSQEAYFDNKEKGLEDLFKYEIGKPIFQKIYYGTPGSGKSFKVSKEVGDTPYRTIFHPDSDYASFVGCYKPVGEGNDIGYSFVEQVFTTAYIDAWKHPEKHVNLVIEEINRGNCAQIFGDLFQLLDRRNGYSEYPVTPNKDLQGYLAKSFSNEKEPFVTHGYKSSVEELVKTGSKMVLPSNLSIIATMNTSDQSLFPMDSAFKRRWEWEYVPVCYDAVTEDGNPNEAFDFMIDLGEGQSYRWIDFLKGVNIKIKNATDSEDKQMGNFFIKSDVDASTFVNKVMFYLWSEVCKDEYHTTNNFFRYDNAKGEEIEFSFNELYPLNDKEALEKLLSFVLKMINFGNQT